MHGQFVWYDLMTTDVEGAKKFYQPLAGWSTKPFPHAQPDNPYTMWTHGGSTIGGVAKLSSEQRSHGAPPMWMPSVEVNNVDATTRHAESLGAKVIMPAMDIPDTGRYAVLQDPQGAAIAIFSPKGGSTGTEFDGTPRVGRVSWHELMATEYRSAADFYRQVFGWEKVSEMDMGPGGMYYMYGLKGKMYGGMYTRPMEMAGVPPFWLVYIFVRDLKKSMNDATRMGAKVENGPMDIPGGSIVVLSDPQGAAIALHSDKPWAVAAKPAAKKASKPKPKSKAKKKAKARAKPKAKAKPKKKAKAKAKPRAKAKKKSRR
jgi:predicted enzyme related to lactoylglutathione lyase